MSNLETQTILIVAGEASGEMYGAELTGALRDLSASPNLEFFGCGGARMRDAGVDILVDIQQLAVLGPIEAITHLKHYLQAQKKIREESLRRQARLAILIDFPDFNLRLAPYLKALGMKVVYFISPQIWAWRTSRVRQIQRCVDRMLVILPFEKDFYGKFGVEVDYVGHPLVDRVKMTTSKQDFFSSYGLQAQVTTLCLLPGSRKKEIHYHLPLMLKVARRLSWTGPVQFLLPAATPATHLLIDSILKEEAPGLPVRVVSGGSYDAVGHSDLAVVASGTATLETALLLTPMIAVFRISNLTWIFGQYLVRIPHYCLVNLIAGERLVPELYQTDFNEEQLWSEIRRFLDDPDYRESVKLKLAAMRGKLGSGGAIHRAARIVNSLMTPDQLPPIPDGI
jgi:lipid-A-disaccharide synthase